MGSYSRQGSPTSADLSPFTVPGVWQVARSLEDLLGTDMGAPRAGTPQRSALVARALELDVIPRLVLAHGLTGHADAAPALATVDASDVERFTHLLLNEDDELVQAFITGLRERQVSLETLFMDLLAPAAGHLGLLWERDLCAFSDVTIALGRLQILLRELGTLGDHEARTGQTRRLLLLGAPGEQHTFGLHMVGEFFHREGWDVEIGLAPGETAAARVRSAHYDVVGLTAGTRRSLAGLSQIIASVRRESQNPHVSIILGGPMFNLHPEQGNALNADAIITDGASAPALAERLVAAQKRPR